MIYFIGAGPGDVELITVKGKNLMGICDVIIYTGSLINHEILRYAKNEAKTFDSSCLHLEEIIEIMKKAQETGLDVARLHTGDPTIYSAIREQMEKLDEIGLPYEVIPGVSSLAAAAAVLKKELTVPGVSQTIIITRVGGRTPIPAEENLEFLAERGATMAIFLSVDRIEKIATDLAKSYGPDMPAAVVYKATWPEQRVVIGTLRNIAEKTKGQAIDRTALVLVGNFLDGKFEFSRLYHPDFSHGFRGGIEKKDGSEIKGKPGHTAKTERGEKKRMPYYREEG
ncbi:MAG: precorrin-4 C(11)-methyltransferase [Candidatus Atribacteria bacterium]|nr:precorrin-4 C(11)-methyltransferase [Candidatus Atribacteria bacterium]